MYFNYNIVVRHRMRKVEWTCGAAAKISVTLTLKLLILRQDELKLMNQTGFYFRSTYSTEVAVNLSIRRISTDWNSPYCEVMNKFTVICISIRLIDLKQYPESSA